ncbi:MAG TPA: ATP-binding protein [Candidatus Eisenbacteria bacterium]
MIPPRRGRSLFWTIAGLFLLTLVLGTLAQALMTIAVLHPLEDRDARARAELVATSLAAEIAAAPHPPRGGELEALREAHRGDLGPRPPWAVWRPREGAIVTAPTGREAVLDHLLTGAPLPDSLARPVGGREPPLKVEVVARRSVVRGSDVLGEVLLVRPVRPRPGPAEPLTRTSLLFLPIAMLASAFAGLAVVRLLVRRLRALGILAARVTEGDLGVRIADTSGDEIGQLAEQLDQMTERLARARDQVEHTERQRRQLFADITHELATPLTSIRGYAETMVNPGVPLSDDERQRYLRGVMDESRRLDRMIRDLFELARLEAGASPLATEPLDWAALCQNTLERFQPRFRDARLRLVWRQSLDEAWIEADGHRMEEVLENLLANALRYVPEGGTVELALERAPGRDGAYALSVSDDGPGLPAEELPHVFERFYRGADARAGGAARDDGGSGLGLAIVREIIERHGGTVRAESRVPRGLSIVVELPQRA